MQMLPVSIIGGTGAARQTEPPTGTVAETPHGMPDLRVNIVSPLVAVTVRFVNVFLVTFFGLLGGDAAVSAMAGVDLLPIPEGANPVVRYALLATGPAITEAGKSLVTIFRRLENKYPLLTGSI